VALTETEMRTNGFVADPVAWQSATFSLPALGAFSKRTGACFWTAFTTVGAAAASSSTSFGSGPFDGTAGTAGGPPFAVFAFPLPFAGP
jgi:hypothetical protein